jgi:Asp/Glu/hydantoin racemase
VRRTAKTAARLICNLTQAAAYGGQLKEEGGAESLVMGCAGVARHRAPLEEALGLPVIDPTQAVVRMALGAVQFSRR